MTKTDTMYRRLKAEYQKLCNSPYADTRKRLAAKFKDADDYIRKDYMLPTLARYKAIEARMTQVSDFVTTNWHSNKLFHELTWRYSHEFNRFHSIMRANIEGMEAALKHKTMYAACNFLETQAACTIACTRYLFEYENFLRKHDLIRETFSVKT